MTVTYIRDKLHQLQQSKKIGNIRKRHSTKLRSNVVTKWFCWLRGTVIERWSLTGELSLSCARPAADG